MKKPLKDKVIIITGASMNIGKEIAIKCAQEGAKVIIADIEQAMGKEVEQKINSTLEGEALFYNVDVSKTEEVEGMINKVTGSYGHIDILINNAVNCPIKPFQEITADIWDKAIGTNLKGTFLCTKAVIPFMVEKKMGKILNVTTGSVKGGRGFPFLSAYCASKGGIVSFTHAIGAEFKKKQIDISAFFVSICDTDITQKDLPQIAELLDISFEKLVKQITPPSIGRFLKPKEVANAIVYSLFHPEVINNYEVSDLEVYPLLGIGNK